MSFSCSDFTDDTLNLFIAHKLIKRRAIQEDDPQQQFTLIADATHRLITERDELAAVVRDWIKFDDRFEGVPAKMKGSQYKESLRVRARALLAKVES
jgi:hypothetical protein